MLIAISLAIVLVIFGAGAAMVRKRPKLAEKTVGKLVFVGFVFQMLANWLFWGKGVAFNPFAGATSADQSAMTFLFLCLVSIFCYASLLVILLKMHDFYNGDDSALS